MSPIRYHWPLAISRTFGHTGVFQMPTYLDLAIASDKDGHSILVPNIQYDGHLAIPDLVPMKVCKINPEANEFCSLIDLKQQEI